jgi:hypothetical protein
METFRAFMEAIRTFIDYGSNGMHKGAEFNGDIAKNLL